MKIKMLTLASGSDGVMQSGMVYDLPADQAAMLVEGNYAECVDEPETVVDPVVTVKQKRTKK